MITLASYPRSGNTFLRNVLFEVYGIPSGTFLLDGHGPDADWQTFAVVKTHHLPHELPEFLRQRPAVYLLRDGRDSLVSFAHHRKDIVAPGSDYRHNLLEAIYAAEGSHFGGWSRHVEAWSCRASVIIRFEELIRDPIGQCQRLRPFLDMPPPQRDRLPDFESLKHGIPEYGAGKEVLDSNEERRAMARKWFRKGKTGVWKDELPEDMQRLFWHLHGETMEVAGYARNGAHCPEFPQLGARFTSGSKYPARPSSAVIEASKVSDPFVDGIKRYVVELLRACERFAPPAFHLRASVDGISMGIEDALALDGRGQGPVNSGWLYTAREALRVVLPATWYHRLARAMPLQVVRRHLQPWRVTQAPAPSKEAETELLHLTLPQNYRFVEGWNAPVIGTVHDWTHALFPDYHDAGNAELTAAGMEWLAEKEATLLAVSQSTRQDLSMQGFASKVIPLGVDRRKFHRIPNKHLLQLVRERYNLPEEDFLLSVSTLEPRKNLPKVLEAYALLPAVLRERCHLVLAGRKGWKWTQMDIPANCRNRVHVTGFVRDDHLPALHTLAHAFCYLSFYEGFGLPVLEAMACGTPVITSNTSSLPEVVGDAGLTCDPKSASAIAFAMEQLLRDKALYQRLSREAQERSWEFTWSRTAEQTLAAYRECLERHERPSQRS